MYSHHCNGDGISNDGTLAVYADVGRRRFRSQYPSHYSYRSHGVYCHGDWRGDDGEVDRGLKRPYNIPKSIVEQVLMVMVEVDIGIRTATIPPITHMGGVYCWVSHFILVLLEKMFTVTR